MSPFCSRARRAAVLAGLALIAMAMSSHASPLIVNSVPADHTVGAPLGTNITLQFGAPIDPLTLLPENVVVTSSLQGTIPVALSWNPATSVLTINPQENLMPGERVEVALTKAVLDSGGLPLANGWRSEFSAWTAKVPESAFVTTGATWNIGSIAFNLTIGDLTGDNLAELVFSNVVPDTLTILSPNGAGGFSVLARIFRPDATLPRHVALGDLDEDGLQDLVVCASGPNQVQIIRNLGGGAFAAPILYSTGQTPYGAYVGDVDADGDLDVATANFNSHDVSILKNSGGGMLMAPAHYPAGPGANSPRWVDGADFDHDGDVDLAACNGYSHDVSVLLNNGSGVFTAQAPLLPVDESPQFLATRDFDGDGVADIVTVNSVGESVSLLIGVGDGTFQSAVHTTVAGQYPYGIQVVDLDGDKDLDLVLPIRGMSAWQPVWNDGSGALTAGTLHFGGTHCHTVGASDWDGDGDIDVAAGFAISRTMQYYEQAPVPAMTQTSPARSANGAAVDAPIDLFFNVDLAPASLVPSAFAVHGEQSGAHEVALAWSPAQNIVTLTPLTPFLPGERVSVTAKGGGAIVSEDGVVYAGDVLCFGTTGLPAPGLFAAAPRQTLPGADPVDLVAADFDGDGRSDLAVANLLSDDVTVLLSTAGAPAVSQTIAIGAPPVSMAPVDFDGDGDTDLAVAPLGPPQVVLLRNDGGALTSSGVAALPGPPFAIAPGDLDRDGDPDLAVAVVSPPGIAVLRNDGASFSLRPTLPLAGAPTDVTVADLDVDGALDVAATVADAQAVRIFVGDGTGAFADAGSSVTPSAPVALFAGDVDGDGAPDLAVPGYSGGSVSLLTNLGGATFAPAAPLILAAQPRAVVGADLTGDGQLDLAAAGSGDGALTVLCKARGGDWAPPWTAEVGDTPFALAIGDFNGDGRIDLAVVNRASGDLAILWAESATGFEPVVHGPTSATMRVWPNPFAASLTVELTLPSRLGSARLSVLDVAGRVVARLLDEPQGSGRQLLVWDGRDGGGRPVGAGVYFMRLETPGETSVRKVLRLR